MKVIEKIIKLRVKELIYGLIKENILEHESKIICFYFIFLLLIIKGMAKDFIYGQMAESMKELTKMIKSMVLEFIHGLMEENMKVIGLMENSMAVDNLHKEMK